MSNYIYLIIVLIGCLLGAVAILYENLSDNQKRLQEKVERLERELNS